MILTVLLASAFLTSGISAVFGMAGGMILMGILAAVLTLNQAMIYHGVIQMTANFWRALLLRSSIRVGPILYYMLGCIVGWGVAMTIAFQPSKELVYLALGLVAFLPRGLRFVRFQLDFSNGPHAALCGVLMMWGQIIAGAAGPVLDIFFVDTALNKEEIIATKAGSQVFSHFMKITYFYAVTRHLDASVTLLTRSDAWNLALCAGFSMFGTSVGKILMKRLSESTFRRSYRLVLELVGLTMFGLAIITWYQSSAH